MSQVTYYDCICVICGELFQVEKAKKRRRVCPSCNAAMQRGELQRPCETCGEPMIILSLHRRFCPSCLAARDQARSRDFKREYINKLYQQKHTCERSQCDNCSNLSECSRLVWTTLPLKCQAHDLTWPEGRNPALSVRLAERDV